MTFYAIQVYFVTDIESTATRVLRKAFREKPTQDEIKDVLAKWVVAVSEACDNQKSLFKVKTIIDVQVIDLIVEDENAV